MIIEWKEKAKLTSPDICYWHKICEQSEYVYVCMSCKCIVCCMRFSFHSHRKYFVLLSNIDPMCSMREKMCDFVHKSNEEKRTTATINKLKEQKTKEISNNRKFTCNSFCMKWITVEHDDIELIQTHRHTHTK